MKITKKNYILEYSPETDFVTLHNTNNERLIKMPVSALLTENGEEILSANPTAFFENDILTVKRESLSEKFGEICISFLLNEETVEVSFTAEAQSDVYIEKTELFRSGPKGMYMPEFVKYFAPAPRNNNGVNRAFQNLFCDCSLNGYFSPAPLNFCVGNRTDWVAFGLLDLPDSYEYKLTSRLGILLENRGGVLLTKKGDTYKAPRLLISFPKTDWDSIPLFRNELAKRELLPPKRESFPSWWKKPLLVTYGDQMMDLQYNWYTSDDWGCDAFTVEWLDMWLDRAESILGENDFTVVVDAFWQNEWSADAKVNEKRFSDLRKFIDKCHKKGHKVLLWTTPLIDKPSDGTKTLSQETGVLSPDAICGGIADGTHYIDFTSDNISLYFDSLARRFFGSDPDSLDCDGLKMDFLASLRNPEEDVHYQHPEKGIGIKEMYIFYSEFQKAAEKVKPDVLLNGSGCDPRFENVMAMNRLHDIQNVYEERELRARVSALACPHLLIDSDGAIMLTDWVKETYIKAVVYSTPSLYYVNKFHDGIRLSDSEMRSLCALLSLSSQKTDGTPFYNEDGDWIITDKSGKITAHTFGGDSAFVYDGKETFNFFSWSGGEISVPVYDYAFSSLPENCRIQNGFLHINAVPGKLYQFKTV